MSDAVIGERRCWYAEPALGARKAHGPVSGPRGAFLGETVGDLAQQTLRCNPRQSPCLSAW